MSDQVNTISEVGAPGDVVFGAEAIAREIGLPVRSVFHLGAKGELPGIFRVGQKLAMSRLAYRRGVADRIAASSRRLAA